MRAETAWIDWIARAGGHAGGVLAAVQHTAYPACLICTWLGAAVDMQEADWPEKAAQVAQRHEREAHYKECSADQESGADRRRGSTGEVPVVVYG